MFCTKSPDGTSRQLIDWIYYFFTTVKLKADTDLHSFSAEDIETFRYLAYYFEKDKKERTVYVNISDYNDLANQEKKACSND